MKKVILTLALLAVVFIAGAQTLITTGYMKYPDTYWNYATDVTLTNTTPKYFVVDAPQPWPCQQDVCVYLDSLAGNHTNVAVALYGRKSTQMTTTLSGDGWTAIGSAINFKGGVYSNSGHDTTLCISNVTENEYRQYKILFTGTGTGTTTIGNVEVKLYYGQH
jgi:hypothetical protein